MAIPILLLHAVRGLRRFAADPWGGGRFVGNSTAALENIHYVPDIHADEVIAAVTALRPDLGLVYGAPILKPKLFKIPPLGTLGIHHGRLPDYRGVKTAFWAMFNGEKTAGVTIQRINAGLDTGEVVSTGEVVIGRKSLDQVNRELEDLGLDLYIQTILDVRAGKAKYVRLGAKGGGKPYRHPSLPIIMRFRWRQFRRRLHPV
jgi:methionyl-tRNA formyltransferase